MVQQLLLLCDLAGMQAKHKMVASNMRLVVAVAKRFGRMGVPLTDLVQEGSLGLIRAAEKYDPERGFKFSTYASWWIQQSIYKVGCHAHCSVSVCPCPEVRVACVGGSMTMNVFQLW